MLNVLIFVQENKRARTVGCSERDVAVAESVPGVPAQELAEKLRGQKEGAAEDGGAGSVQQQERRPNARAVAQDHSKRAAEQETEEGRRCDERRWHRGDCWTLRCCGHAGGLAVEDGQVDTAHLLAVREPEHRHLEKAPTASGRRRRRLRLAGVERVQGSQGELCRSRSVAQRENLAGQEAALENAHPALVDHHLRNCQR